MTSARTILKAARKAGATIATAESCTGGLLSGALTEIPGSSDIFERGFVTYSNEAKEDLLGVAATTIAAHGAVSEEVAREMAEGALTHSRATIAISVTGVAGPGSSESKPEGRVCFAIAVRGGKTASESVDFGALGRKKVRKASVKHALGMLKKALS